MTTRDVFRSARLLALVIAGYHVPFAAAADRQDAMPCPGVIFFGDYYHAAPAAPHKRREFAGMLLGRIQKLDAVVPELSPAEREWLARELSQAGPRSMAASDSIENQKFTSRAFIRRNLPLLKQLSKPEGLSLRKEVALWAVVAQNYENYDSARAIAALAAAHVIGPEFAPYAAEGDDGGEMLDFMCRDQARQISYLIVVPFLKGELRR